MEVEQWLRSLPFAEDEGQSEGLFHLVYQHGRRWELTDVNPIDLVRQRGGRRSIPSVLSVHDIRLVLEELTEPYRTMLLVAVCLGLRASEIMGLQWGDFNWGDLTVLLRRVLSTAELAIRKPKPLGFSARRSLSGRRSEGAVALQCAPRTVGLGVR
jgi:integrase